MHFHHQQYRFPLPWCLLFRLARRNWIPFHRISAQLPFREEFFSSEEIKNSVCDAKGPRDPSLKKDTLRQGVKGSKTFTFTFFRPESHFPNPFLDCISLLMFFLARDSINSKPLPYRPRRGKPADNKSTFRVDGKQTRKFVILLTRSRFAQWCRRERGRFTNGYKNWYLHWARRAGEEAKSSQSRAH